MISAAKIVRPSFHLRHSRHRNGSYDSKFESRFHVEPWVLGRLFDKIESDVVRRSLEEKTVRRLRGTSAKKSCDDGHDQGSVGLDEQGSLFVNTAPYIMNQPAGVFHLFFLLLYLKGSVTLSRVAFLRDNVVYWKTNGKINNDLQSFFVCTFFLCLKGESTVTYSKPLLAPLQVGVCGDE